MHKWIYLKLPNPWDVALGSMIIVADVSNQNAASISTNIYSNQKIFQKHLYKGKKHFLFSVKFSVHLAAFEANKRRNIYVVSSNKSGK
jgi:hypothetical protein